MSHVSSYGICPSRTVQLVTNKPSSQRTHTHTHTHTHTQFNWYLTNRLHNAANAATVAAAAAAAAAGEAAASPLGAVQEREREVLQQLDVARQLPRVEAVEISKAELISGYIPLEEAFMRHSVEKGIRNTERDEDATTSKLIFSLTLTAS